MFWKPAFNCHPSVPQGSWGQPWEDDTGCGCSGGHVCVAGLGLCDHPGLHHQPRLRRITAPAGQDHQVAPPRPQVDHHSHRPLYHPLHHQTHRQVRSLCAWSWMMSGSCLIWLLGLSSWNVMRVQDKWNKLKPVNVALGNIFIHQHLNIHFVL